MDKISVNVIVNKNIEQAWNAFTNPKDIVNWNFASDDWCCPSAQNELFEGGKFSYKMSAKNGSTSFDFAGTYTRIIDKSNISFLLDDGREVQIFFTKISENKTKVTETFEMENENIKRLQRQGWQQILNNYKNYID